MNNKEHRIVKDTFTAAEKIIDGSVRGFLILLPYVFSAAFFACLLAVAIRYLSYIGAPVDIVSGAQTTVDTFLTIAGK